MSPDLGAARHQGLPTSPQWESELELGSDDNNEDEVEIEFWNDEDWNHEGLTLRNFIVNLQNDGSSS